MNKIIATIVTLALCGGVAFSQGMTDAYKYGQTDLNGTARYLGMGGAFGALGGDISVMKGNPAGLGVYRSSEVVTTLSLNMVNANADWLGVSTKADRTYVGFDNIAYVGYFPTGKDAGIVGWNVGFAYNRIKNFRRNYEMSAGEKFDTSLSDYIASRAYGYHASELGQTDTYDPYSNQGVNDWLSALGYNAGLIKASDNNDQDYYSSFGDKDAAGDWHAYKLYGAELKVNESGSIDEYNVSFAMNISNRVFLGATVAATDINYSYESSYDEAFEYDNNDLYIDNGLSTDGTGYTFNIGAIVRPADFLRLGVAYNSPTWYKMTDYYYGKAGALRTYADKGNIVTEASAGDTPASAYTEYEYRTPDKWLLSAAAIIGQSALVSVDYEMTNYKGMKMYDRNGTENVYTNDAIKTDMGVANTLRVGAELKVTPQFAIRAGGAWSTSPISSDLKKGWVEVATIGTIPNYTLDRGVSNYTVGFGYRFTPNFYTDLACVFTNYKEDVYAFSSMFDSNGETIIEAQPATMSTKTTRVALTFGCKF